MPAWVAVVLLVSIATPTVVYAKQPSTRTSSAARLIGTWSIDPTDEAGIKAFDRCTMEFKPNGQLIHSVPEGKMLLSYRVEGDVIISDQPSHAGEVRTHFAFTPEGNLVLEIGGQHARFLKQSTPAR
jgi:hypothetical protein